VTGATRVIIETTAAVGGLRGEREEGGRLYEQNRGNDVRGMDKRGKEEGRRGGRSRKS